MSYFIHLSHFRPFRFAHGALIASVLCLSAVGCSSSAETNQSPQQDAGISAPAVAPETFDCRSLPKLPERASKIPSACGTDRNCRVKQVCGHRGVGGSLGVIAPENTLAAYRAAIALGIEYVETDPRPTKDNVLVNVHDTSVDRTTTGHGEVKNMTLAEVQSLPVKADKFAGDFSCEHIPTLRQILETCRGRVHVLVDANKTDRVDLLVDAIIKAQAIDWAIFDTSSLSKIKKALAIEPKLNVMPRVESEADLAGVLDALKDHPPVIIEISGGPQKKLAKAVHDSGNRAFMDVFGQDFAANVDPDHDPSVYATPFEDGADIIQSDRPDLVLRYLKRDTVP